MARRVTLRSIAERVGVSPVAVSAALGLLSDNSQVRLSSDVATKIRKVSKEMGYQHDRLARAFRSRRTYTVGVLLRVVSNPQPVNFLIDSIHRELARAGYRAHLSTFHSDFDRFEADVREFVEWQADGLIMTYVFEQDDKLKRWPELEKWILRAQVPTVFVNSTLPGLEKQDLLEYDMIGATREATHHLLSLGHKKIAYVGEKFGINFQRYEAARAIAKTHGATLDFIHIDTSKAPDSGTVLELAQASLQTGELIASNSKRPTGLICGNDTIAAGIAAAFDQYDIRVPQHASIIGHDNAEAAILTRPGLTTFAPGAEELASLAVKTLLEKIENPEQAGVYRAVSSQMILRGSTGQAPS